MSLFSSQVYRYSVHQKPKLVMTDRLCTIAFAHKAQLIIEKGDITQCPVEALVNAANEQLLGGAGVCGAIFNAAGWDNLQEACDAVPENDGIRCLAGQAIITDSFNLRKTGVTHIIHAVGPHCLFVTEEQEQDALLSQTYKNSLRLADQNQLTSLAFPFISTGIFGFPKERAATIALKTIVDYIDNNVSTKITTVRIVLFSQEDCDLVREIAKKLFS